jgi:hypothetical protein
MTPFPAFFILSRKLMMMIDRCCGKKVHAREIEADETGGSK